MICPADEPAAARRSGRGRCRGARAILGLALAAAPGAYGACQLARIAELPVSMEGLSPVVPVRINGADARLIADSGAYYSILSPGSAARFGLKLTPAPAGLRLIGLGGEAPIALATVEDFALAGAAPGKAQFIVGGSEPGHEVAGVLGQNVLRIADVEYDLADGVIRLMRPKDCARESLAYWAGSQPVSVIDLVRTDAAQSQTRGAAYLNGTRIHVMFDTGAAMSLLTLKAAARAGVRPGAPGIVPAAFLYGFGRQPVQTWIAPFASFKLGSEEIRHTHLRIGDIENLPTDMLIGADFFLSHRVYVSNAQRKLYFTYNGGAVFNLTTSPLKPAAAGQSAHAPGSAVGADTQPADAQPADAADLARRGAAFAARGEFEHALADLTRACELAPQQSAYFYQRGLVRERTRQPELALQDFDRAIRLEPHDLQALMGRARLRLDAGDAAAARPDLDAADGLAAAQEDLRFEIGVDYARAGLPAQAIAQYDLWIRSHPDDVKLGSALELRCQTRALLGRDLDAALDDCNAALRLAPRTAQFLYGRGLVRLRRGDYRRSVSDFDAALRLQAKFPMALYGRGLDQLHLGRTAAGNADIAAAAAIQPRIAEQARQLGITP